MIRFASMSYPAIAVAMVRVAMSPVDHSTLRIPFVFAFELDFVAHPDTFNSRRKIDIVCDQQTLC